MKKRFILAKEGHILIEEGWLHELTDYDAALRQEMVPYELIHALVKDVRRLEQMVIETREEVNRLSPDGVVYDMTGENVFNGIYWELPAVKRHIELYGDEAEELWEA